MKVPTLRPTRTPDSPERIPDVVTVRPVRAAFGPHLSLVSVDSQGRLWMRFSTAMGVIIAGMTLMMIPMLALWWVGGGLVDSGQIDLNPSDSPSSILPGGGNPGDPNPTELPLAGHGRK